jgi:RNA polymerase sigma-70 factor (ECF subfamily)
MTAVLTVACDAGCRWQDGPIESFLPDPSALMVRVQRGDQAAFADLYDAIASVVHGVVLRVLRDPAQSEEVTQEVFVELWSTAARFDPSRANVTTWAVTIARRRAIDRVRKEQSQRDRVEQLSRRRPDTASLIDDDVVASLDAERVSRALAELPGDQRQVIELAFLEGWSHSAIAASLGLPLGTVKGRVRSGLQRLGSRLGGRS